MADDPSSRIRDAVALMTIAPDARVLEVGCGHGVATTLVCEQLGEGGSMVAIDRSTSMVADTGARNAEHVLDGRLVVRGARIARASLEPASFDVIFAINVRDVWGDPATSATLRDALATGGSLWAFMQLPPGRDPSGADTSIAKRLAAAGFEIVQTGTTDAPQVPSGWVQCSVVRDQD